MVNYTLRFQDFRGKVFSTAQLVAANDDQAIEIARRIYKTGIGRGYEIQCEDRLVHVEDAHAPNFSLTH